MHKYLQQVKSKHNNFFIVFLKIINEYRYMVRICGFGQGIGTHRDNLINGTLRLGSTSS